MELTEQTAAGHLLAGVQALRWRERRGELNLQTLSAGVQGLVGQVAQRCAYVDEDRPLERELREVMGLIRDRGLEVG